MKISKILLILASIVLIANMSVVAMADGPVASAAIVEEKAEYSAGDTIEIIVSLSGSPVANTMGVLFEFDKAVLTYADHEWLREGDIANFRDSSYKGAFATVEGVYEDLNGEVFSIKFKVNEDVSVDRTTVVCKLEVGDDDGELLPFDALNSVSKVEIAFAVPPHDHIWIDDANKQHPATPASCTTNATYYKVCSVCGTPSTTQTFEVEGTALGHNYGDWEPKDGDNEKHYRYCANEGCTVSDSAPHDWQESRRDPATCVNDGTIYYSCSACGGTKTEPISATGHNYGAWEPKEGDDEKHYKYCTNEGCTTPESEDHTFDNGVVTTDPSCEQPGETTFTCDECGYSYTEPISATGHTWINDDAKKELASEATCTSAATYYKVCSDCGTHSETETFEVGEPLGHDWSYSEKDSTQHNKYCAREGCDVTTSEDHELESEVTKEPSCYAKGVTTFTCDECGYSYTEEIPATEHAWGEWTSAGESGHKRDCENDGCTVSESESHAWSEIVDEDYLVTKADCDSNAVYKKSCSVCGEAHSTQTFEAENTALGHTWSEIVHEDYLVFAADCDSNAVYKKSCSVCGTEHETETFEAKGTALRHAWSKWESVDEFTHGRECSKCGKLDTNIHIVDNNGTPLIDKEGFHTGECIDCKDTHAIGHCIWGEWKVSTPATCYAEGEMLRECIGCGADKFEPIEKVSHEYGKPTPDADGETHTAYCVNYDKCGASVAENHEFDNGVVTTQPSCFEEGEKTFTCGDCAHTKTEPVDATGKHEYGKPTPDADGETHTAYCVNYGDEKCKASVTENHEFDNGVVTTQPSCFEAGEKTFTCGDCAHTKTEPVDATGDHVLGDWVDSLDGLTHTRTCVTTGCPEHETHNYSLVLAFNDAGHWRVCESGCTRVYGYELHNYSGNVCINCGYTKPANEIVSGYIYVNEDYHMMILTNGVIVNNHVLDVNDICIYCLGHVPSQEDDTIVDIEEPIEPSTEEEETDIVPETEEPEENPETGVAFGTLALAIASMAIALCKKH